MGGGAGLSESEKAMRLSFASAINSWLSGLIFVTLFPQLLKQQVAGTQTALHWHSGG